MNARYRQRGATLIEVVMGATLFAWLSVAMFTAGPTFSAVIGEQMDIQETFTNANVIRMRVIGDSDIAGSILCDSANRLSFVPENVADDYIDYFVSDGDLIRRNLTISKDGIVAENIGSLSCNDLGNGRGIYVGVSMGNANHPYHLHLRVSDTGMS